LLDGLIAPSFTTTAIDILKRKGDKCRFLANPALANLSKSSLDTHPRFRYVRGGFLRQPNYTMVLDFSSTSLETSAKLSEQQKQDIILAWAIGSTSNSNTITIVKDGQLLGNGVGQQDRVGGCELAIKRALDADHNLQNSTAYSDSFFPFPDGPLKLIAAGIKTIFATRGSVKDEEIKKVCMEKGAILVTLPDAGARGFFGH
jgi:phosphoribosylaminoimidazolecarboxamide formyltransferase/IMP cyclohydrolase